MFNRDKNKDINDRTEKLKTAIDFYKKSFRSVREQFNNQPDVLDILDRIFSLGTHVGRAEFGIEVNERMR